MKRIKTQIVRCTHAGILLLIMFWMGRCTDIPEPGSLAPDISYKNRKQYAIAGMKETIGVFQVSTSTLPLTFEITEISEAEGNDISALTDSVRIVQYTEPVTGNESEEELILKMDTVLMPAVSVNQHTGEIEVQEGNNIVAGEYHFNIKVSNTSGSKILEDAIIIEFNEYELVSWSSDMAQEPVIERIADTPNQILFVGHLDDEVLPGDRIDFTKNRSQGFAGTFVDDTDEGEVWSVDFPVEESDTYCTWAITDGASLRYESANFSFILGRSGSYEIHLYK